MTKVRTTRHSEKVPRNMQEVFEVLRNKGSLCDMRIKSGKKEFPVHKIVMAASSGYLLDTLLADPNQDRIVFGNISGSTTADIIEFCYTSKIDLDAEYAIQVLKAAYKLNMKNLIELCIEYIDENVSLTNYGAVIESVAKTEQTDIPRKTLELILDNFEKVAAKRHILRLKADSLVEILSSEKLNVKDEEIVLKVVRDWYYKEPQERASSLDNLLDCVRFALIKPKKLLQLRKDKLSFKSERFLDLVNEAINFRGSISDVERHKEVHNRLPTYFKPGSYIFIVYDREIKRYDLFHHTYNVITCPHTTMQNNLRTFLGGAVIEDKLYIVDDYGTMEIFDISNNLWINTVENREFSSHRSDYEAVFSAGEFVYVISEDSFARFNSKGRNWETIPIDIEFQQDLKINSIQGACSLDDQAIIISMNRTNSCGSSYHMYEYTQFGWKKIMHRYGDKLIGLGKFISLSDKIYSPRGRKLVCLDKNLTSHELPDMNLDRGYANLFEVDDQIVVFGGEPSNTLERFDTRSGEWSSIDFNASFNGVVAVVKYVKEI